MVDWTKHNQKQKLAQELLDLLRGEITNRKPVQKNKMNNSFKFMPKRKGQIKDFQDQC